MPAAVAAEDSAFASSSAVGNLGRAYTVGTFPRRLRAVAPQQSGASGLGGLLADEVAIRPVQKIKIKAKDTLSPGLAIGNAIFHEFGEESEGASMKVRRTSPLI